MLLSYTQTEYSNWISAKMLRFVAFVVLYGVLLQFANANNVIDDDISQLMAIQGISFLKDPDHQYSASDFSDVSKDSESQWQDLGGSNVNFLYDDATYWFRFEIDAEISEAQQWVLDINWPFLDYVTLYVKEHDGKLRQVGKTGDKSERFLAGEHYRLPKFHLELKPQHTAHYFLQVDTSSSIILPLRLSRRDVYELSEWRTQAAYGFFFGALLIMALYNGIISVFTRDKSYAYYVVYLLALMFYMAQLTGFGLQHIWGNTPWILEKGLALGVALSFLFGAVFVDHFLNLRKRNAASHKILKVGVWIYSSLALASLFLSEAVVVTVEQGIGLIACFMVFAIAWYEWRHGNAVARYFIFAWTLLLVGTCAYTLLLLGLLPRNIFTENIQMVGIAIEMLVLSIALADRINRSRIENVVTLKALLETSKEKYETEADAKARGEFFAKMSHEIRTPIGGVLGIADLLKETNVTVQQENYINIIYNAGTSLLAIVNDILDFSKMDSGNVELESVSFDLNNLISECVDIVAVKADKEKLTFTMSVDTLIAARILGDPIRLRQVLLNFLSNAVKFTEEGNISINVVLKKETEQAVVLLFSVSDGGIGLSETQIGKLFQPFQQADKSTTRRFGGTGLGLAICKEIVELMGGEIGVESQEGKGSRFWFTAEMGKVDEKSESLTIATEVENTTDYSKVRLLIAEDNPVNTIVLKGLLKKRGIQTLFVENGNEVVEAYTGNQQQWLGILMDCEMPEMDGFEASCAIRSYERTHQMKPTKIVALTAHSFGDFTEKAKECGMDYYLMKPITDQSLMSQIDTMLQDE